MAVRVIQSWGAGGGGGGGIGSGPFLELDFDDSGHELALTENLVAFDTSGGNSVLNLPAGAPVDHSVMVKRVGAGSNTLTIEGNGSTVDGETSRILSAENEAIVLMKRASGWAIW